MAKSFDDLVQQTTTQKTRDNAELRLQQLRKEMAPGEIEESSEKDRSAAINESPENEPSAEGGDGQ